MKEQLTLNEYQEAANKTAIYPVGRGAITYTILGLNGEAGELANKLKKVIRDDGGVISEAKGLDMAAELGDVLWYVSMVARELGFSLEDIGEMNLEKLSSRMSRGKLSGSGDDR